MRAKREKRSLERETEATGAPTASRYNECFAMLKQFIVGRWMRQLGLAMVIDSFPLFLLNPSPALLCYESAVVFNEFRRKRGQPSA